MRNVLSELWKRNSDIYGDKIMLSDITSEQNYTYREFFNQTEQLAKGLIGYGIKKGEHIGLLSRNSAEWLLVFAATTEIGCVLTMLNTALGEQELISSMKHADVKYLFAEEEMLQLLNEDKSEDFELLEDITEKTGNVTQDIFLLDSYNFGYEHHIDYIYEYGRFTSMLNLKQRKEQVEESDVATIQFTSGTTGNPKAVQLTQKGIVKDETRNAAYFGYSSDDKMVLGTPLFHILGYAACFIPIVLSGARLYIMRKFSTTKTLQTIEQEKCTAFCGVPTLYQFLCEKSSNFQISSLRFGIVAGALCSEDLVKKIFTSLRIRRLENYYGQTETLTVGAASFLKNEKVYNKGFKFMDGINFKILDLHTHKSVKAGKQGELIIQSDSAMPGYYKNDEATKKTIKDGWLYTGDLAVMDENGLVYIKGRMGDTIIRGGENISATEVENQIMRHPMVKTAAVLGVPDQIYGQEVCAFVMLHNGEKMSKEELLEFLKENSGNKIPKFVHFVREFPYTASGKVQKFKLLEMSKI